MFCAAAIAAALLTRAPEPHVRVASARAEYPPAAARAHLRGPVVVDVTVDRAGRVSRAAVLSGDPRLAPAAVRAVERWRFRGERAAFHVIAGINVAPTSALDRSHTAPPPVDGRHPAETSGRASLQLTVDGSGQVVDALGISGSRDMLIVAIDGALRWETPPLNGDSGSTFACAVDWLNVGTDFTAPPRCRFVSDRPDFGDASAEIARTPVVLEVMLEADGRVRQVKVLRSNPALDDQAANAVRQWRFAPLFVNGRATSGVTIVAVGVNRLLTPTMAFFTSP